MFELEWPLVFVLLPLPALAYWVLPGISSGRRMRRRTRGPSGRWRPRITAFPRGVPHRKRAQKSRFAHLNCQTIRRGGAADETAVDNSRTLRLG